MEVLVAKPDSLQRARDVRRRDAEVVKAAVRTPEGKALLELLDRRFGYPVLGESSEQNHIKMGSFELVRWLAHLEKYEGLEDDG